MTLLTADEFRALHATELGDEALEMLLSAAESAIATELGGDTGAVTEIVDGGLLFITLRRRASSITTITEKIDSVTTTLTADDFQRRYDARTLERLGDGTHPSGRWGTKATVLYEPENDEDERKRVQSALVALDLNYEPGTTAEQIGAWLVQRQQSSVWNYEAERKAILASLWPSDGMDFA